MWVLKCKKHLLGFVAFDTADWIPIHSIPMLLINCPSCMRLAPPLRSSSLNPPTWSHPVNPLHICKTNFSKRRYWHVGTNLGLTNSPGSAFFCAKDSALALEDALDFYHLSLAFTFRRCLGCPPLILLCQTLQWYFLLLSGHVKPLHSTFAWPSPQCPPRH